MLEKTTLDRVHMFSELIDTNLTLEQQVAYLSQLPALSLTAQEYYHCANICLRRSEEIMGIMHAAVDLVGTGGGRFSTFNISIVASFIVAGAGVKIAKQVANRAVLEALKIYPKTTPEAVTEQLYAYGLSFVCTEYFHPCLVRLQAAKEVAKTAGVLTVCHALAPLIHPGRLSRKAIAVCHPELVGVYASVLKMQGVKRAIVFHGDGMDKLSLTGENHVAYIINGEIEQASLSVKDTRLSPCHVEDLAGGTVQENAAVAEAILQCRLSGPKRDIVLFNAAAAIYAGYPETIDIYDAIDLAQESLESGAALTCFRALQHDK